MRRILICLCILGSFLTVPVFSQSTVPNGLYPVVREASNREALLPLAPGEVVVVHDPSILEGGATDKVHLVVRRDEFAPLSLKQPPQKLPDQTDRTLFWLGLTLDDSSSQRLEEITRAHLGQTLAVVVGGNSVTKHGIKSVIKGGKVQISRCGDNGCQVLFRELHHRP